MAIFLMLMTILTLIQLEIIAVNGITHMKGIKKPIILIMDVKENTPGLNHVEILAIKRGLVQIITIFDHVMAP